MEKGRGRMRERYYWTYGGFCRAKDGDEFGDLECQLAGRHPHITEVKLLYGKPRKSKSKKLISVIVDILDNKGTRIFHSSIPRRFLKVSSNGRI